MNEPLLELTKARAIINDWQAGSCCQFDLEAIITQALLDVAREKNKTVDYWTTQFALAQRELAQARAASEKVATLNQRLEEMTGWRNELGFRYNQTKTELVQARADLERAQKQMRTAEEALQESKFFSSVQLISGRIDAALEALTKKE